MKLLKKFFLMIFIWFQELISYRSFSQCRMSLWCDVYEKKCMTHASCRVILKKIEVIWLTGHITSNFFSRLCFPPHKKWSFDIKNFFSKCEQIRSFMRISYHVLKKSLMENFIFFLKYLVQSCILYIVHRL